MKIIQLKSEHSSGRTTEEWTYRLPEVGESRKLSGDGGEFTLRVRELLPELRQFLLSVGLQVFEARQLEFLFLERIFVGWGSAGC